MRVNIGFWTKVFLSLLIFCLLLLNAYQTPVVRADRDFSLRYNVTDTADLMMVGNTIMSCVAGLSTCNAARNGTASPTNNNNNNVHYMAYVDADSDATTFSSSSYTLALPSGSKVLWAGLYWGGVSTQTNRSQIKFKTPSQINYSTLSATQVDTLTSSTYGDSAYQGFVEVTSQVASNPNGTFWAANVYSQIGSNLSLTGYGGWSLVTVYSNSNLNLKSISVFDGIAAVNANGGGITRSVSGFYTPPSGAFNTKVSIMAYEGDAGFTGDNIRLNSTNLTNTLNPLGNFFNSTITDSNIQLTSKNPNYINQLGFDLDTVDASGILSNGATTANVNFLTTSDGYYPGVMAFTTTTIEPKISAKNYFYDLNGGILQAGDILEYVVEVSNTGNDSASNVLLSNPIPAGTSYVPNSLKLIQNKQTFSGTDLADADFAFLDNSNSSNLVQASLGESGVLAINGTSKLIFRLQIDSDVNTNLLITSQAQINFRKQTAGSESTIFSDSSTETGFQPARISIGRNVPVGVCPLTKDSGGGSNTAQAITSVDLCVSAGPLVVYAGDSNPNNDICEPANIASLDLVDTSVAGENSSSIICSNLENSITLSPLQVSPNRQNATSNIRDIIVEDLRGFLTSNYVLSASVSDFANDQNTIFLGSNPDQASTDTDLDALPGPDQGKLFVSLNPSVANLKILQTGAVQTQGFSPYSIGPKASTVSQSSNLTLFSTTNSLPGKVNLDGMNFKLRLPAYPRAGNYQSVLTLTVT